MLLAAGRGQRMRELTDNTPKPLLEVAGKPLIEHHIEALSACGIKEFVINLHYLGEQIQAYLGDGSQWNVAIQYSQETTLLGMGGGVKQALPLLGDKPFIVMSNDIWTDYPLELLLQHKNAKAHLVLVDNPAFHLTGDYSLAGKQVINKTALSYNYAGIGVFSPEIFQSQDAGAFGIMPVLAPLIEQCEVTGEHYQGLWLNLNTPEDLALAN